MALRCAPPTIAVSGQRVFIGGAEGLAALSVRCAGQWRDGTESYHGPTWHEGHLITSSKMTRLMRSLPLPALLLGVQIDTGAQVYPQWGALEPGPYEVGFRVLHTYDYSRGYWPKVDYQGRRDTLETARPMQISIWYPAAPQADVLRMKFGDYIALIPKSLGHERASPEGHAEAAESLRRGPLNPFFPDGVSEEDLQRVLDTPTAGIRDAQPEAGPFPLVIHAGFGLIGQTVLLEYLASHGYVVATFPLLGTSPAWYNRGEGTAEALQAVADDIGFVYGYLGQKTFADRSRTAVIGMFSASGLLFQMQHMQLDALAVLDGRYPEELQQIPGFDTDAVRVPILDMPRADFRDDRSLLDSLRFADRYLVRFDKTTHLDFYQFQRIADPERAVEHVSYRLISRYTRAFLDAVLKNDAAAASFLREDPEVNGAPADFMTLERRPAEPAAPTQEEFLLLVRQHQIEEARRVWEHSRGTGPHMSLASEEGLTTTLLFLRRDHGAQESIEAFRLLVDMFPKSWQAREHLAVTWQRAGEDALARESYREVLRLLRAADITPNDRARHEARIEERLR